WGIHGRPKGIIPYVSKDLSQSEAADALVIVAHPDDETIFCGGLMLAGPARRWHVLSLCRCDDVDRAPKFHRVCRHLGAEPIISDLDDSNPLKPIDPAGEIGRRIINLVGARDWQLCVTHGENGEYGHPRHRQIHREVVRLVDSGLLRCGQLWTFAYDCDAAGNCRPRDDADIRFELPAATLTEKRRIIHEMYGYGEDSFEVAACVSPEAFRRLRAGENGEQS
ncbi:MAG: PIG-L deacetylase family protein, partial [Phycisphaerae bacterium]